LHQPDKSSLAEHSTESGHRIKFHGTEVLSKTPGSTNELAKEAKEIKLHADSINREEGSYPGKYGIPAPD
jgi:hypothetical protein